ncbi:MAG: hypothetical protein KAJ12_02085 [Bacteroidetes bacterium]|nr:hypothetical protein [Bacteroidota bacterium]
MERHVTVVAALQIGWSVLWLVFGVFLFVLLGILSTHVHDPEAEFMLPLIAVTLGGFIILTSLLGIIGGIGLLKYKNWARILILVLSAMDLLNIPIGTALAIYTIWVLVQTETARMFTPAPAPGTVPVISER